MWNQKKVSLEGNPETAQIPAQVDGVNIWDRGIHAIKFRLGAGKTDIVVIPVHMKSNVGGVNKTKTQRAKEAAFLIAEISKLKTTFNDSDFVILGDTNVLSGDEPAVKNIVDAGFLDLNETDVPTTYSGPAPFDRIFLAKNAARIRRV
jgi:predicted extracellular nuclease